MSPTSAELTEPNTTETSDFDKAEVTACCNASEAASCCDVKDKAACCGTPAGSPAPDRPPSRCGCR
jgi:hypothetical protein